MTLIDHHRALLARWAATLAVARATAAGHANPHLVRGALETAVRADDAAILARLAARRHDRAEVVRHLAAARRAAAHALLLRNDARRSAHRDPAVGARPGRGRLRA